MSVSYETLTGRTRIAYIEDGSPGRVGRCGFMFLGGFKSDMQGTKAETIAALARETRRSALRFDYSGHGKSSGLFVDGTISQWLEQSTEMFVRHTHEKCVLIGSSMGGWLALLMMRALQKMESTLAQRIAGMVLIAPAADMTTELLWKTMPEKSRREVEEKGITHLPSQYGEPYPITAKLLEDGVSHLLLKPGIDCPCPVRILQGDADPEVPPQHAWRVFEAIRGSDVTLTIVKGGDHRLSAPTHLTLIRETVLRLAERADGVIV